MELVYFAFIAILFGVLLFWFASRQRQATGLPGGKVIYTDTREWGPVEKPLYDDMLSLTGKPDYLVHQGKMLIPVEVKSSRGPNGPYDSHIYQLAAYCMLVESTYGIRPAHGILKYPDRTYEIEYSRELENNLLDILAEMRKRERQRNVSRSHERVNRCQGCGYRSMCDERL